MVPGFFFEYLPNYFPHKSLLISLFLPLLFSSHLISLSLSFLPFFSLSAFLFLALKWYRPWHILCWLLHSNITIVAQRFHFMLSLLCVLFSIYYFIIFVASPLATRTHTSIHQKSTQRNCRLPLVLVLVLALVVLFLSPPLSSSLLFPNNSFYHEILKKSHGMLDAYVPSFLYWFYYVRVNNGNCTHFVNSCLSR